MPMDSLTFARRVHGALHVDVCWPCQAIWFDQYESAQLTPSAVIDLFRRIHDHRDDARRPLPDHLHCVWRLPEGDTNYPTRWRLIKSRFSRAIPANEHVSPSRWKKSERGLWQRRYWEHLIRDELDLHLHLDYIHFNPVKHGLVSQVRDWPHSSFHRFVDAGHYEVDWGASQEITKLSFE